MLVNLVPEFLAVLAAPDPAAAYHEYFDRHGPVLASYWHNYVLDPTSPHAEQVIAAALRADRADLKRLLADVDVVSIAEDALQRGRGQRRRAGGGRTRHRVPVPRALHRPGEPTDVRHGARSASPAAVGGA